MLQHSTQGSEYTLPDKIFSLFLFFLLLTRASCIHQRLFILNQTLR